MPLFWMSLVPGGVHWQLELPCWLHALLAGAWQDDVGHHDGDVGHHDGDVGHHDGDGDGALVM